MSGVRKACQEKDCPSGPAVRTAYDWAGQELPPQENEDAQYSECEGPRGFHSKLPN